ncbi:MAG TPA: hypothetical protein VFU14_01935 [Acidimicrobiales bacterium]|nr:hypothetical protein [Acidimicrobiales bacterium]
MLSGHDEALVAGLRAGAVSTRVAADDPDAVARELVGAGGAELVGAADLVAALQTGSLVADRPRVVDPRPVDVEGERLAVLARRVLDGEEVVSLARAHERTRARRLLADRSAAPPGAPDAGEAPAQDGAHADHQAVRFALVVLVLAQLGGIAVFVAAGDLLAVVAPATALVGLALVVAHHQRPPRSRPAPAPATAAAAPSPAFDDLRSLAGVVAASPTVRAAEAHLRRQQAAWKVAWWEREQPVPDPVTWLRGGPATVVCVDRGGEVDEAVYATMTAELPAVIRVVVLEPRRT